MDIRYIDPKIKYPALRCGDLVAMLTPEGWESKDEGFQNTLNLDLQIHPYTGYDPIPLNGKVLETAKRFDADQVFLVRADPSSPPPNENENPIIY